MNRTGWTALAIWMGTLSLCASSATTTAPSRDGSVYQLESSWTNQEGKTLALGAFRGKPAVLAMVYTSCQSACPVLTSDIQRIEQALPGVARESTRFVLVSFDSGRDNPEKLRRFAESHALDLKRWALLTGSEDAVRDLAAVLGIKYRKSTSGDFAHSNVITILDAEGLVRHQQIGLRQSPDASVETLSALLKGFR